MSKVNEYMDRKIKAIHRLRRYETKSKKYVRKKRALNSEYGGRYYSRGLCGYTYCGICYYEYENSICSCCYDTKRIVYGSDGLSYVSDDGLRCKIIGFKEDFVIKLDHGTCKKYSRQCAARKTRRKKFNEETVLFKGCGYKRDYDLAWEID